MPDLYVNNALPFNYRPKLDALKGFTLKGFMNSLKCMIRSSIGLAYFAPVRTTNFGSLIG